MKKQLYILYVLAGLFASTACEEVGPAINFETETVTPIDTATNNETQRTILLEEFTGAQCANCPAGAALAQQLADESGDRVIIVSIHSSGVFSLPYLDEIDFRTTQGNKIENMLGKASGYPSASINRKLFDGELNPIVTSTSWSNFINKELAEKPIIDTQINASFKNNQIEVSCNINVLKDIPSDVKLSVVILEDDIVSPQNVDGLKINDYVHQHVFRTMLTPFDGELIATQALSGDNISKAYQLAEISAEWNTNKLSIVAFAHGNSEAGVYQAAKVKL